MQKTILITGCSSGIGWEAAHSLHKRGYRVFASARKAEDVEKLRASGLESVRLDINDAQSIKHGLEEVLEHTQGELFALFNNAGFLQAGAIEDLTHDMIRAQFETNVFGPMELCQLVLPIMRKQGYGRIIQNSSILGQMTMPFCGAYNASKFALEGFSHTLRQELRRTNIHVVIISPGPVTSQLRQNAFQQFQEILGTQQTGHYAKAYQKLIAYYFNNEKQKQPLTNNPSAVTIQLIRALESNHPKVHYYVGGLAHFLAFSKKFMPERLFDWIITQVR